MKLYRVKGTQKGKVLKRKNKRIFVRESINDSIYLELRIFEREKGHFAMTTDQRGIKSVSMRLSPETAELMAMMILEHLEMFPNKKI